MPLVRYEIRNEHSLANPQLYRGAAKDDPEGLLEGVAMAGLVGIVRQLGDLAEFAAEVFRDLHEEVMATASRGHELLARVQQLEAEMPAVEKALLSETNQLRFAYTPGADWHASIRYDQNHCTQGDLPRFIRHLYEECRGPPRLFLLDKFDVAGAGACLKRYTDPSFFRTEWASSELMKAERVQRDKKARREKKKGRRRKNGNAKESLPVDPLYTRFSKELAQPDQPRNHPSPPETSSALENLNLNQSTSRHDIDSSILDAYAYNKDSAANSPPGLQLPGFPEIPTSSDLQQANHGIANSDEKESLLGSFEEVDARVVDGKDLGLQSQQKDHMEVPDDIESEGEQFLDALATMESELDSESDRFRQDRDMDAEWVVDKNNGLSSSIQDLMSGGKDQTTFDEKANLLKVSPRSFSSNSSNQDVLDNSGTATTGLDSGRLAIPPNSMHVRRKSMDPISISRSMMAKHDVKPQDGVLWMEDGKLLKDDKGTSKSVEPESATLSHPGVMVSKMVAVFERASLEQMNREDVLGTETIPGFLPDSRSENTIVSGNQGVVKDDKFADVLDKHYLGLYTANSQNEVSNESVVPQLEGSSFPLRIKVKSSSSLSRYTSQGSLDSSPHSPSFSALHSPTSPVRTSWIILSSPDSQRLGFKGEINCLDSLPSIPVLALSPTARAQPTVPLVDLEITEARISSEYPSEANLARSSSTSSVELPSGMSLTGPYGNASSPHPLDGPTDHPESQPFPAGQYDDHVPLSPASSTDHFPNSTHERVFSKRNTSDTKSADNVWKLDTTFVDGVPSPTDEGNQNYSPKTQALEYGERCILSLETLDDIATSSTPATGPPNRTPPHFLNRKVEQMSNSSSPTRVLEPKEEQLCTSPIPAQFLDRKQEQLLTFADTGVEEMSSGSFICSSSSILSEFLLPMSIPLGDTLVNLHAPSSPPLQNLTVLPSPTPPSKSQRDYFPSGSSTSLSLHELPPPPPPLRSPPQLSAAKPAFLTEVQDTLLESIVMHDKSTLKKINTMQNPSLRNGNDRSHLLEQIRAQSFNLRHTVVEKLDPHLPRPVTNISVAAILEKANAIRQAFAGSDEDDEEDDDDWSDVQAS